MSNYETIKYERRGRIAYLMFNRPEALNTMTTNRSRRRAMRCSNSIWTTRPGF